MNIVCAQSVLYAKEIFSHLGNVEIIPDYEIRACHLRKANALIIRSQTTVDKNLLDKAPISFVGTATAGFDHVDTAYLKSRNIYFKNAAGANANSVAEYIITALLTVGKKKSIDVLSKTIGVVGVGHVGSRVVYLAQALGMRVLMCDPPLASKTSGHHFIALEDLVQQSEIITLHVPLSYENFPTYHLINEKILEKMQSQSILINTSRGAVIQEASLLQAMKSNKIGPVILDVFEGEPDINSFILESATIVTPHIAGHSIDGKVGGSLQVYRELCQVVGEKPLITMESLFPNHQLMAINETSFINKTQDCLENFLRHIYDIEKDHRNLLMAGRMATEEKKSYFKALRKNYDPRFEFHHYHITENHMPQSVKNILQKLGFQ